MASHKDLGVKFAAHKPGCVTRHIGTYIEGNTCSHRWQAAKRARAETRIDYVKPRSRLKLRARATAANLAWLATYRAMGKLFGATKRAKGMIEASLKSFATVWWPWPNNAHHIIPRSVLANTLAEISKSAGDREPRMFHVMIESLLKEKYNLNDMHNMIMLPIDEQDGADMNLPAHLEGGKFDHPAYSKKVKSTTKATLRSKYTELAKAIKNRKHNAKDKVPAVRALLEDISNTTYDAIITKAAAARNRGAADVTLDSLARQLYK